MELLKETICRDTQYIIEQYYSHNLEPLLSAITDDCVWLSVGNLLISGKQAIKSCYKNGFIMPHFVLENPDFRLIETGTEEQLLVLGQFFLHPVEDAKSICAVDQRISFCFRREGEEFHIYHMHVSNGWSELMEDEVYPVHMGARTYQYVQKLLKEKGCTRSPKLVIKSDNISEFVDTSLLVYVEAMDKSTILHTAGERREIKVPFKEVLEMLPPVFFRLHRSYAINCAYVEKIERYTLTLVTQEQLPIPKMRYRQISEEIEAMTRKL